MTFPEATKEEKRSIRRIRNQLVKGKDEKPANTITNFVTVLENDPRLEGAIRLNEMNGRVHIVKPLGWKRENNGAITDTDINYIRLLIEQTYGLVGEKPAVSAIDIVANEHRYHPIPVQGY